MNNSNNHYINKQKHMPVFQYTGGNNVTNLPQNTQYKWIDQLGGGRVDGPLPYGAKRPDGVPAHGGVYTNVNNNPTVEYHGYRYK